MRTETRWKVGSIVVAEFGVTTFGGVHLAGSNIMKGPVAFGADEFCGRGWSEHGWLQDFLFECIRAIWILVFRRG